MARKPLPLKALRDAQGGYLNRNPSEKFNLGALKTALQAGQGYMYSGAPASAARRAPFFPAPVNHIETLRNPTPGYMYSGSPASMARRAPFYPAPQVRKPVPTHLPTPPGAAPGVSTDPYADVPTQQFVNPGATWGQVQGLVSGMVNPLMQALIQRQGDTEANLQAQGDAHANALAAALSQSAQPVAQAFQNATQQSAATADAVSNALQGEGGTATRDLAARLAQIGGPVPGADQMAQTYKGADQAGYTRNSLDVQNLIAQGADANAYLAKQPGIARLAANQDLQQALAQSRAGYMDAGTKLTDTAVQNASDAFNTISNSKQNALNAQFDRATNVFNLKRQDAATAAQTAADQRDYNLKVQEDQSANNQATRDYKFKVASAQVAALQHDQDQYQKQILTLQALRTASADKAAKNAYDKQIAAMKINATANQKALDNATRVAMLNSTLNTRAGIANANNTTRTTIAANSLAGQNARTQAQIDARVKLAQQQGERPNPTLSSKLGYLVDANGNPITNKNGSYNILPGFKVQKGQVVKDPTSTGASGTSADSWQTPGSSKRNRVIGSVAGNILVQGKGGVRTIRGALTDPNNVQNVDTAIWNKVNASIRAQGINPETPAGKELRKEIYHTYIEGARAADGSFYHIPKNWAIAKG